MWMTFMHRSWSQASGERRELSYIWSSTCLAIDRRGGLRLLSPSTQPILPPALHRILKLEEAWRGRPVEKGTASKDKPPWSGMTMKRHEGGGNDCNGQVFLKYIANKCYFYWNTLIIVGGVWKSVGDGRCASYADYRLVNFLKFIYFSYKISNF